MNHTRRFPIVAQTPLYRFDRHAPIRRLARDQAHRSIRSNPTSHATCDAPTSHDLRAFFDDFMAFTERWEGRASCPGWPAIYAVRLFILGHDFEALERLDSAAADIAITLPRTREQHKANDQ